MEKKMEEKNEKKISQIKERFDDFSVEIIKVSGNVAQAMDSALSEKIKGSLETLLKLLTLSNYENLCKEETKNLLNDFDKELSVLGAFIDIAQGCKYISKEEYEKSFAFIKDFENLISKE